MKSYQILLIALCILWVKACLSGEPNTKEDCHNSLSEKDKEKGYSHCCFYRVKRENKEEKDCIPFTQYQYDHFSVITKNKDIVFMYVGTEDINLDCGSAFFKLSLLSIILLLL